MRKKSIIGLFVCLLGFGVSTTSCEDMLTPDLDRYSLSFSGTDTVGFYLGILRELQEVIEQNVLLGELRSDLMVTTDYCSDSISDIANFRSPEDGDNALLNRAAYYKVINQCNFYLDKVDTMAVVRSEYYMRKECAQVQLIRAWVYMQLVQNYGSVPFITKPVDRANTGWETNPEEGWVTADNLLDKLQSSVEQAALYEKTLGFPNYGTFQTGYPNVSHTYLLFPSDVVIGDLYLLRGHSGDYEKAAAHYYQYLVDFYQAGRVGEGTANYSTIPNTSGTKTYYPDVSSWTTGISSGDLITEVPSAANSFFGLVLTRLPQIYGFDTSSSNTTVGGTNEDGSDATTTSGSISLTPNYKNRQVAPSQYFENLAMNQIYRDYENYQNIGETMEPLTVTYPNVGDARLPGSAPYVDTDKGRLRFIQKMGSGNVDNNGVASTNSFSYNYMVPVYRARQVYLRYAEAINRAGFPRYAFTLLRDGLNADKMPRVRTDSFINIDDVAKTKQECPYLETGTSLYGQLSIDEVRRASGVEWLDFSAQYWMSSTTNGRVVYGAHERGCGFTYAVDTLYTYENLVLQRIADEEARSGVEADAQTARMRILAEDGEEGGEPEEPGTPDRSDYTVLPAADPAKASAAEINAVETLIADEMALETAYEGFRFYDLMRIARHKNNDASALYPADYGTQWMAWLISRRALQLKPYENPKEVDASLYGILLNPANWYLQSPKQ